MCSVAQLLATHGLQPSRLLCPWNFPGKNTGADCHFLLQGLFPSQGWNPRLQHWQADSLPLRHVGSPLRGKRGSLKHQSLGSVTARCLWAGRRIINPTSCFPGWQALLSMWARGNGIPHQADAISRWRADCLLHLYQLQVRILSLLSALSQSVCDLNKSSDLFLYWINSCVLWSHPSLLYSWSNRETCGRFLF